jgi:hypothetical protein
MERPGKKLASRQSVHAEPGEGDMTALKPLETQRVTGQVASRYMLNMFCAMPECPEPALDAHHIFPRSQIGSTLWFVQAFDAEDKEMFSSPLAHVTGLCREHHDDVEEHRAWIKLEGEEFVWYWRNAAGPPGITDEEMWQRIGPLDPQPAGREKAYKPKKRRFKTDEEVARRRSVSIKLPIGIDGIYWRDLLKEAAETELEQEDTQYDPELETIPAGKLLITVLERFTGRAAA